IDGSSLAVTPSFIVNPKNIKKTESLEPPTGGEMDYDQSLNTTDNVKFAGVDATNVTADNLIVTGQVPTGTLATPPAGVLSGDMWADTTDSSTHPVVRVML